MDNGYVPIKVYTLPILAITGSILYMEARELVTKSSENARHALNIFYEVGRLTDDEIGELLGGKSRQTGFSKRHSGTLSLRDIDNLSDGLGVPPNVFLMEPDDVQRWITRHDWRPPRRALDLREPKRSCNADWWVERPKLFDDSDLVDAYRDQQEEQPDPIDLLRKAG